MTYGSGNGAFTRCGRVRPAGADSRNDRSGNQAIDSAWSGWTGGENGRSANLLHTSP
jgi:hypothetical protein